MGHFIFTDDAFNIDYDDLVFTQVKSMCQKACLRSCHLPNETNDDDDNNSHVHASNIRWDVSAKTVHFTPLNEVEDLAQRMHGLSVDTAVYAACYTWLISLAPIAAQVWPPSVVLWPLSVVLWPSIQQATVVIIP